jgi:hypothetical protein
MANATSSASSSSASVFEDVLRLIAPSDRVGFHEMLQTELRGRSLPNGELRQVANGTPSVSTAGHGTSVLKGSEPARLLESTKPSERRFHLALSVASLGVVSQTASTHETQRTEK